jgi:ATP-dependent RNA helicase DeaD
VARWGPALHPENLQEDSGPGSFQCSESLGEGCRERREHASLDALRSERATVPFRFAGERPIPSARWALRNAERGALLARIDTVVDAVDLELSDGRAFVIDADGARGAIGSWVARMTVHAFSVHRVLEQRVPKNEENAGFEDIPGFELTETVLRGFEHDGIRVPTAVQRAAIEPVLTGRHVVIESGTGTGKTLAYVLPLLQRLRRSPEGRVVCFAPAAELAMQTLRTVERYKEPDLKVCSLLSTSNQKQQRARFQQSTRFVVGTPPCILEMYSQRKLKGVTTVVLDEPEPILAGRDAEFLWEVLSRPEPKVQLIFAAATFGANAERWIRERMGEDAVRTRIADDPLRSRITHAVVRVRDDATKDRQLASFIEEHCERAVVFVNQPHLVRHLYRFLNERRLATVTVSHERPKAECKQALADFNRSQKRVLLTTDRAATGLDLPGVDWVLNYELPMSAEAYVHRAGRTARAGKVGQSVLFVTDAERPRLERIARDLQIAFQPVRSN